MKNKPQKYWIIFIILFIASSFIAFPSGDEKKFSKEIPVSSEKEIKVNIDAAFGDLVIMQGEDNNSVNFSIKSDANTTDLSNRYEYIIRDQIGYLRIQNKSVKSSDKKSFSVKGFDNEKWKLEFPVKIPVSFDIELGAGKGRLDFSGLQVKDLNISTGASSVTVLFDKKNEYIIENINIESGVSRFKAYNLNNANFNSLKFSGGLGAYDLDFNGDLNKEVDVNIEIGLGSLNVYIPQKTGAKIWCEKNFITNIDIDKDFIEETTDEYVTSNYYSTKGKMNIRIEAGVGTVKVKRLQ